MAFFGIFFIMLLFLALVLSIIIFIVSLILFIISNKKKDKKVFKIIKIICIPTMCLSAIPIIFLLIFLVIQLIYTMTPPKDYVNCSKITHTEFGFVDGDGLEYITIDYKVHCTDNLEGSAYFSYAPNNLFEKYKWRNIYECKLNSGFTIYYEYTTDFDIEIYVAQEDFDSFIDYYEENFHWNLYDDGMQNNLNDILNKYLNYNFETVELEDSFMCFEGISNDDIFLIHEFGVSYIDEKYYLCTKYYYDKDLKYYRYFGYELTDEEANSFTNYINS